MVILMMVLTVVGCSTLDCPLNNTTYMSYHQPEDVFYFEIRNRDHQVWKDTVTVKKENYSHFESVDCGPSFFHTITEVKTTHNYIDSIVINNKEVNYDASKAHFYIYFGNRH